jgi:anti-anti-sigma factor
MEPSFTTRAETFGDSVVVHVDGDIDVATSGQLGDDIAPLVETGPNLVLDLTEVPFMDTVGLGALLATRSAALEHGGSLTVRNPSPAVQRVLDLTGLTELLAESTELD